MALFRLVAAMTGHDSRSAQTCRKTLPLLLQRAHERLPTPPMPFRFDEKRMVNVCANSGLPLLSEPDAEVWLKTITKAEGGHED